MRQFLWFSTAILATLNTHAKEIQGIDSGKKLVAAMSAASADPNISSLVFQSGSKIELDEPAIFRGKQDLTLVGNGAQIDGSQAGSFEVVVDEEGFPAAKTADGTLMFNTTGNVILSDLAIRKSATRGLVVNVPSDATQKDVSVTLERIEITDSALFGLHLDDNADDFDDGAMGSSVGFNLTVSNSVFMRNGTGALDFDGIRVDERGDGDINSKFTNTKIDENGGDGIELDEAGNGNVIVSMQGVSISRNGFYNEKDLDDGFDIDEAGPGHIEVELVGSNVNNNMDEGLDFDEENDGHLTIRLRQFEAASNKDEGIKGDEEGGGNINLDIVDAKILDGGDDGIQLTELGEGKISAELQDLLVTNNRKAGIKLEQWNIEDDESVDEPSGQLIKKDVVLKGNGKNDDIVTHNIMIN